MTSERGVRELLSRADHARKSALKPPPAPTPTPHVARMPESPEDALVDARIRALEDAVDAGQTANIAMKRLYGRALIRRRAAERERDALRAALAAAREEFATASVGGAGVATGSAIEPPSPLRTRDDDDRRSVASFASSALFGENPEVQLESLADLVALLEAKLAVHAHARGQDALTRARSTIGSVRAARTAQEDALIDERDALKRQLEAATNAPQGTPSAAQYAALKAELADARADANLWRARAVALERLRERGSEAAPLSVAASTGGPTRPSKLETELADAKRTIGRLVSERSSLRRGSAASAAAAASFVPVPVRDPRHAPSGELVRRVQEWREKASSETGAAAATSAAHGTYRREDRPTPTSALGPATVPISSAARRRLREKAAAAAAARGRGPSGSLLKPSRAPDRRDRMVTARTERGQEHLLPDRLRSDLAERARRAAASVDAASDVAGSEAESAHSQPVGIVGRHTSFGSARDAPRSAAQSTTGPSDATREFFVTTATRSDGLRGLVANAFS